MTGAGLTDTCANIIRSRTAPPIVPKRMHKKTDTVESLRGAYAKALEKMKDDPDAKFLLIILNVS
jgi:hypothetical protein